MGTWFVSTRPHRRVPIVLAGIIGAMIAAPLVAVGGAVLGYVRERSDEA